jgi:hypothetical protein
MDAFWSSFLVFVAGGYTGMVLMALLYMTSRSDEQQWRVVDARRTSH